MLHGNHKDKHIF